jgi:hypothetical protein
LKNYRKGGAGGGDKVTAQDYANAIMRGTLKDGIGGVPVNLQSDVQYLIDQGTMPSGGVGPTAPVPEYGGGYGTSTEDRMELISQIQAGTGLPTLLNSFTQIDPDTIEEYYKTYKPEE